MLRLLIGCLGCLGGLLIWTWTERMVEAAALSWDSGGGSSSWSNASNWSPNADPGGDDLTIGTGFIVGGGPDTVVNQDYTILSLDIQNSSTVDTDGNRLVVNGPTLLSNAGTILRVRDYLNGTILSPEAVRTDTLFIGTGATVEMYDDAVLEVDNGLFTLFGTLQGNGELQLHDNLATPTSLFNNSGTLSVGLPAFVLSPPPRTLRITRTDVDARIDLDGDGSGEVFLQQNATLDIDVAIIEPFSGTMSLGPASTLDVADPWSIDGTVNVNTSLPALTETATITGDELTLASGAVVTLDEADESLRFAAPLLAAGGSAINNSGIVVFDAPAQFDASAVYRHVGSSAHMVVNSDVTNLQTNFFVGGSGNQITVNPGAVFTFNGGHFGAPEVPAVVLQFDATININSGEFVMDPQSSWTMDGTLNMNNSDGAPAVLRINSPVTSSQTVHIGNDSGTSDANIVVGGTGESQISYRSIVFHNDADVDIAAGAILNLGGLTVYSGADATFDGAGTLKPGQMTVIVPTTFNVGVVDLEDDAPPESLNGHAIRAPLTINADAIDDDGDGFDGKMTITNDLAANLGELEVNIPPGQFGSWSFDSGEIRLVGPGPLTAPNAAEMLDGSAIEVGTEGGTLVVEGWARTTARLDIYGTVSIADETGDVFVLNGGTLQIPNRLIDGLIDGNGKLDVGGEVLAGFGTINAQLSGSGSSRLVANDGTLTINNTIAAFDQIEVTDGAVLDVALNWNTTEAGEVILSGGELTGATLTNDSFGGIHGYGLITAPMVNNTFIRADSGGTLVIEESAGVSQIQLDGLTSNGIILAQSAGSLLHLRRIGNAVLRSYDGTVRTVTGGQIHAENFRYRFTASSLVRFGGGGYSSDRGVEFLGEVVVDVGSPATLSVDMDAVFGSTSTTTLGADLMLDNAETLIESGAEFSGIGSLVNLAERNLIVSDGVGLPTALINHGVFDIGNDSTDNELGTVEMNSFNQSNTGDLQIDLTGLGTGQFDFLMVNNNAILAGTLSVNLLGSFTPVLGNSFTILTTSLGLVDADTLMIDAPIANDLTFELVINPTNIMLQVVEAVLLAGDYNQNGIVDAADYTVWRDTLGSTTLLAADGNLNGTIDAGDYDVWSANFGAVLGSGANDAAAVPEPTSLVLLLLLWACLHSYAGAYGDLKNSLASDTR